MNGYRNKKLCLLLSVTFLFFASLELYLIDSEWTSDEILLIALSCFCFTLPFLSLFFPKKMHQFIYRIGILILRNSWVKPLTKDESYRKYPIICFWLLVISNCLIVFALVVRAFFIIM